MKFSYMNFTKILLSNESPSISVSLLLLLNHISIEIREKIPAYSLSLAMWLHVKKAKNSFYFSCQQIQILWKWNINSPKCQKKPIWPLTQKSLNVSRNPIFTKKAVRRLTYVGIDVNPSFNQMIDIWIMLTFVE